jgi:hypothetical protein
MASEKEKGTYENIRQLGYSGIFLPEIKLVKNKNWALSLPE